MKGTSERKNERLNDGGNVYEIKLKTRNKFTILVVSNFNVVKEILIEPSYLSSTPN